MGDPNPAMATAVRPNAVAVTATRAAVLFAVLAIFISPTLAVGLPDHRVYHFVEKLTDGSLSGCCRTASGGHADSRVVRSINSQTACEADCAARRRCLGYEW